MANETSRMRGQILTRNESENFRRVRQSSTRQRATLRRLGTTIGYVPEVFNVHMNEIYKQLTAIK